MFAAFGVFESDRARCTTPAVLTLNQRGVITKRSLAIRDFVRACPFRENIPRVTTLVRTLEPERRVMLSVIKRAALLQFR